MEVDILDYRKVRMVPEVAEMEGVMMEVGRTQEVPRTLILHRPHPHLAHPRHRLVLEEEEEGLL